MSQVSLVKYALYTCGNNPIRDVINAMKPRNASIFMCMHFPTLALTISGSSFVLSAF